MPKKTYTAHEGAQMERQSILRFIRRNHVLSVAELEAWIRKRVERYRKRKGGL